MRPLLTFSAALLVVAGCDSGSPPTAFDVDIAVLPYPGEHDNPAATADVVFVAPGVAPAAGDTVRFDNVSLPWTYEAEALGIGQYTLEACVVGRGILEARLDVSDGYQGFVTHGFGTEFTPDGTQGTCAYGSFRVSDRTETPPWEQ
ncbi:hypothetical protein [Rubrivirga marina]|uniref:Lipoprotein n=1 Tax=Rubrivirga marina TaxID=1196024 RepID=A0A271IVX7_9BACT|nr:hypothetical protein [Rubrivirga marina]PAP75088.1 hypothetical protein BSZ37_00785 [Rubrivirga marina]